MPCKLPEIKRSSFRSPLRIGLIVWKYIYTRILTRMIVITLVINLLFMYWRLERVNSILGNGENDSSIHYERVNLSAMIIDVVLNVMFILAAHIKYMTLLKISLIGNIASVMVFTLYSLCMFCYYSYSLYAQYQVSVKWVYIKPLLGNLGMVASGASIEIIMSYAMLLLSNEIKELETNNNYLFRFVNTAAEAKCVMECDEQNKTVDEEKGEENTFEKGTVNIEEESEEISKKATCDYPMHNVSETKCTIEC